MNIYEFILSPDIAAHCENIGHIFNSFEKAVIINLSDKPMKEKHAAWREIIEYYPDMPIPKSENSNKRLHELLKKLIAWHEKYTYDFYTTSTGTFYHATIYYSSDKDTVQNDIAVPGYYSTMEKMWEAVRGELSDFPLYYGDEKPEYVTIQKECFDEDRDSLTAVFCPNGEIYEIYPCWIDEDKDEDNNFWNDYSPDDLDIFIHIPVPFVKGDLLELNGRPYVLKDLPHWNTHSPPCIPYQDYVSGKAGDTSDMFATVFFLSKDGKFRNDYGPGFPFHKLRYYTGELKGQNRFLGWLSEFIKNKHDDYDWIINVFNKYKAEAEYDSIKNDFGLWYNDGEI